MPYTPAYLQSVQLLRINYMTTMIKRLSVRGNSGTRPSRLPRSWNMYNSVVHVLPMKYSIDCYDLFLPASNIPSIIGPPEPTQWMMNVTGTVQLSMVSQSLLADGLHLNYNADAFPDANLDQPVAGVHNWTFTWTPRSRNTVNLT